MDFLFRRAARIANPVGPGLRLLLGVMSRALMVLATPQEIIDFDRRRSRNGAMNCQGSGIRVVALLA